MLGRHQCKSCRFDRCLMVGMTIGALGAINDSDRQKLLPELKERLAVLMKHQQSTTEVDKPLCAVLVTSERTIRRKILDALLYVEERFISVRETLFADTVGQLFVGANLDAMLISTNNELTNWNKYPVGI